MSSEYFDADFGCGHGVKMRSSRAVAERHRESKDHEEALQRAAERALFAHFAALPATRSAARSAQELR